MKKVELSSVRLMMADGGNSDEGEFQLKYAPRRLLRSRTADTVLDLDAATNDRTIMKIKHEDSERSSRRGRISAMIWG